jgi:hypothetical protein
MTIRRTLIDMGLVEMRDDIPVLTSDGARAVGMNALDLSRLGLKAKK